MVSMYGTTRLTDEQIQVLEDGEGRALPELKLKLEDSSKAAHLRVV